jgi:hypothetical protein
MLDVPFAIADATTLTEAGYVGEDVENILLKLLQAADFDVERAQPASSTSTRSTRSAARPENVSITRDVSGEGVQQALLKILEGTGRQRAAAGRAQAPRAELHPGRHRRTSSSSAAGPSVRGPPASSETIAENGPVKVTLTPECVLGKEEPKLSPLERKSKGPSKAEKGSDRASSDDDSDTESTSERERA